MTAVPDGGYFCGDVMSVWKRVRNAVEQVTDHPRESGHEETKATASGLDLAAVII
jgi:predicted metal-dependent phosphoesterase TrpH